MKNAIILAMTLGACSNLYIEAADKGVDARNSATLTDLARNAQMLSDNYVKAARKTRTVQDVATFAIVAAAYSTVAGSVGTASDAALARRAFTGVTAQQAGMRMAPAKAIKAIYNGARRLNCVATAAGMGSALEFSPRENGAAVAATIGAVDHIRILTREGLVQEVPEFSSILEAFKAQAPGSGASPKSNFTSRLAGANPPGIALEDYLKLLANCTSETASTLITGVKQTP